MPVTSHLGYNFVGTVETIAPPAREQIAQYTEQVFSNNQWNGLPAAQPEGQRHRQARRRPGVPGDPSTIKHVFLIVKENRTYDQVLGDDPRGNGDPSLAQFGDKITPNIHALANTFPLIDNLYRTAPTRPRGITGSTRRSSTTTCSRCRQLHPLLPDRRPAFRRQDRLDLGQRGDRCQPLRPNEISGHPGTAPARGSR